MTFFLKKITLFRLICLLFSQIVFYSCVGNSEVSSDSVVGDVVFSTVWFRSFAVRISSLKASSSLSFYNAICAAFCCDSFLE